LKVKIIFLNAAAIHKIHLFHRVGNKKKRTRNNLRRKKEEETGKKKDKFLEKSSISVFLCHQLVERNDMWLKIVVKCHL